MATRLRARRDTAANWIAVNPTLALGEFGWEQDAKGLKLGDGSTAWTSLPYYSADQEMSQAAAYTLANSGSAQQLFNAAAAGSLTVLAATAYEFECMFQLSSMSASSGAFSFGLGGTATFTAIHMISFAKKASGKAAPEMTEFASAAATAVVAASTATVGQAFIKGRLRINAGGTVIPQVTLGVAAAAVVAIDSYCKVRAIGINTYTSVGQWA